jgi:hypothetical protein
MGLKGSMYVPGVSDPVWSKRLFSEPRTTSLPYNNALVRDRAWWCGVKRADSLLLTVINELGINDGVRLAEIKRNWYNLFSKPLSYHMSPSMLSNGEILLNVDSPAWLQELNFYKEDIIKKMSSYGVRAVRFRLGRVSTKSEVSPPRFAERGRGSQKSEARSLTHEELSYIENTVSKISGEALRETVIRTIEKALISGRTRL